MFKGTMSAITTTATTNIPITKVLNTNSNTNYDTTNNTIQILNEGYYDISAMVSMTSVTTGDVALSVLANGTTLTETTNRQTLATGDDYTYSIIDTIKVAPATSGVANISLQFDVGNQVVNNGVITVERRK